MKMKLKKKQVMYLCKCVWNITIDLKVQNLLEVESLRNFVEAEGNNKK